jgi:predicted PurR-regulated permease PerM
MTENSRHLRQLVSLSAVMAIGILLLYAMSSFITPFLSALIFYIMLQPLMPVLAVKWRMGINLSAVLLMAGSFIIILLPAGIMTWMLTTKVNYVLNHSAEILNGLQRVDDMLEELTGFRILTEETLADAKKTAAGIIPGFLSKTAELFFMLLIMYFILFFLLTHQGVIERKMLEYLPFSKTNNALFIKEMNSIVMSSLMGAPLLALVQGLFAWIGYVLFGLPEPLFWAVITALFAFLPMVGTPLVWIPAGLFQVAAGHLWPGIGVLIYGAVVIANVDNVFRLIIQKRMADIHPLVTLLGVIMGIRLIGLPGIIFGPLFISWFLMIVKIYRQEFHPEAKEETLAETPLSHAKVTNEQNTPAENKEA